MYQMYALPLVLRMSHAAEPVPPSRVQPQHCFTSPASSLPSPDEALQNLSAHVLWRKPKLTLLCPKGTSTKVPDCTGSYPTLHCSWKGWAPPGWKYHPSTLRHESQARRQQDFMLYRWKIKGCFLVPHIIPIITASQTTYLSKKWCRTGAYCTFPASPSFLQLLHHHK